MPINHAYYGLASTTGIDIMAISHPQRGEQSRFTQDGELMGDIISIIQHKSDLLTSNIAINLPLLPEQTPFARPCAERSEHNN
jgi:hypothetical protein